MNTFQQSVEAALIWAAPIGLPVIICLAYEVCEKMIDNRKKLNKAKHKKQR